MKFSGSDLVRMPAYSTVYIDLFREWARVSTVQRFEASTERKYNVGIIFKRAQGQGRITNVVGLTEFYNRYRPHIVEDTLFRPGTPRRDWKATLLSDGYLVVRHPDCEKAKQMAFEAATDVRSTRRRKGGTAHARSPR